MDNVIVSNDLMCCNVFFMFDGVYNALWCCMTLMKFYDFIGVIDAVGCCWTVLVDVMEFLFSEEARGCEKL